MAKDMPFDDDMMTMIMGIEPSEPGQHGPTKAPKPDKDAVGVVMEIRDLCEEFLQRAGKDDKEESFDMDMGEEKPEKKSKKESKEEEDEF